MTDADMRDLERRATDDPLAATQLLIAIERIGMPPGMPDYNHVLACMGTQDSVIWLKWGTLTPWARCAAGVLLNADRSGHSCRFGHVNPTVIREELPF